MPCELQFHGILNPRPPPILKAQITKNKNHLHFVGMTAEAPGRNMEIITKSKKKMVIREDDDDVDEGKCIFVVISEWVGGWLADIDK